MDVFGQSRIICGTMNFTCWGEKPFTPAETLSFIKECVSLGIDTFDTADIYGNYTVEDLIGQALALDNTVRERIKIITKCGINLICKERPENTIKSYNSTADHICKSVENSLKALRTNYIDLLLIHRPDPYTHPSEIALAFKKLHSLKTVRFFGVSNYTATQLSALRSFLPANIPITTNQIEFSVLYTAPLYDGTFDKCYEFRITPQLWSPLGGKKLFGSEAQDDEKTVRIKNCLSKMAEKYHTHSEVIALAWVLCHPSESAAVIGTTKIERVRLLIHARDLNLTREDWFAILEAAEGHDVA
jgi:predicted oxidoreductase